MGGQPSKQQHHWQFQKLGFSQFFWKMNGRHSVRRHFYFPGLANSPYWVTPVTPATSRHPRPQVASPLSQSYFFRQVNHQSQRFSHRNAKQGGKKSVPTWWIQISPRELHPLNRNSTAWYAGHQTFVWFTDLVSIVCVKTACMTKRAKGDWGSKDVQLVKGKMLFHPLDQMYRKIISKFKFN